MNLHNEAPTQPKKVDHATVTVLTEARGCGQEYLDRKIWLGVAWLAEDSTLHERGHRVMMRQRACFRQQSRLR